MLSATRYDYTARPIKARAAGGSLVKHMAEGDEEYRPRRVGDKIGLTVTIVAREHYHHGR